MSDTQAIWLLVFMLATIAVGIMLVKIAMRDDDAAGGPDAD